MASRLDPQIEQLLAHVPPYPGARAIALSDLRAFIRQTSEATPKYPAKLARIEDVEIADGDGQPLALRLYRPIGEGPFAVTLYFHGGGFVMGDLDSQDMIARALAEAANSLVVSVDYRLAPEHRYPAAPRDAAAALEWVVQHIASYDGDPSRIASAGDSAGGVLAAVCAVQARDKGITLRAQVHFYGSGGYPFERLPSWHEFKEGTLLNVDDIEYFWELYLPDVPYAAYQPYACPRYADLRNLAPAYVLTAELDPTRDDGEDLGRRIAASGGTVLFDRVPGAIHGFLSFLGAVDSSAAAIGRVGKWMREQFQ